ncbi:MAG: thioesterase [Marinilabiliales bacterium]|nr:MAG: thioesterase [Marinilabiliales bacterium]
MAKNIKALALSPLKMKIYMLLNLPMGLIAGLRVSKIDDNGSEVTVPFKYINKNPFKSMYFAVMSMAAELSSGILALSEVSQASMPVSMLVLNMEASFTKKARTKISFKCDDASGIRQTINKSIESGEGQTIDVHSKGYDKEGDIVAEFKFTWTFKPKS